MKSQPGASCWCTVCTATRSGVVAAASANAARKASCPSLAMPIQPVHCTDRDRLPCPQQHDAPAAKRHLIDPFHRVIGHRRSHRRRGVHVESCQRSSPLAGAPRCPSPRGRGHRLDPRSGLDALAWASIPAPRSTMATLTANRPIGKLFHGTPPSMPTAISFPRVYILVTPYSYAVKELRDVIPEVPWSTEFPRREPSHRLLPDPGWRIMQRPRPAGPFEVKHVGGKCSHDHFQPVAGRYRQHVTVVHRLCAAVLPLATTVTNRPPASNRRARRFSEHGRARQLYMYDANRRPSNRDHRHGARHAGLQHPNHLWMTRAGKSRKR